MPIDELFNYILNLHFNLWEAIKILILISLAVYTVFSYMIVKEVNIMSKTVNLNWNNVLKIISLLHLFLCFFVIYLALVILWL